MTTAAAPRTRRSTCNSSRIASSSRPRSYRSPLPNAPQPGRRPRRTKEGGWEWPNTWAYVTQAEFDEIVSWFVTHHGPGLETCLRYRFKVVD